MKKIIAMVLCLAAILTSAAALPVSAIEEAGDSISVLSNESIVIEQSAPFKDVASNAWYYDEVLRVYSKGLMKGTSETTFSPDDHITRAMAVTILYRLAGEPEISSNNYFKDVPDGKWYTDAVLWAKKKSITNGVGTWLFAPDENISRAELFTLFFRYVVSEGLYLDVSYPHFYHDYMKLTDKGTIPSYAYDAINALYNADVINGKPDNTVDHSKVSTRAEAAALLNRLIEATRKQDLSLLEEKGFTVSVNAGIHMGYASALVKYPVLSLSLHKKADDGKREEINVTCDSLSRYDFDKFTLYEKSDTSYKTRCFETSGVILSEGETLILRFTVKIDGEEVIYMVYPKVSCIW